MSRNTWNSEELRPVTSVTASWEIYSLHPDQSIEHPENNLWIIEADDPTLDSKLINAIVHGKYKKVQTLGQIGLNKECRPRSDKKPVHLNLLDTTLLPCKTILFLFYDGYYNCYRYPSF